MTPREKLGRRLRAYRLNAGLTQWAIGSELGYATPQLVSNWERGICTPPPAALLKLSELLKVRPAELVNFVMDARIDELEAERQELLGRVARTSRRRRA